MSALESRPERRIKAPKAPKKAAWRPFKEALRNWSAEDDETMTRLADDGKSATQIAEVLNRSRSAVLGRARRQGVKLNGGSGGRASSWTLAQEADLLVMHKNGATIQDVVTASGRPYAAIWRKAKKMGIVFSVSRPISGRPPAIKTASHELGDDGQQTPKSGERRQRRLSRLEERAIGDLLVANMELVPETDNEWRFLNGYSDERILKEVFKDYPNPPRVERIEALRRELRGRLYKPPSPKKGSGARPFYAALEKRVAELEEQVAYIVRSYLKSETF